MSKLQATAIEVNLIEHCNLKCTVCSHSAQHLPEKFADPQVFKDDIAALSNVLAVDELKLVGGEPLLHPQLFDFLRAANESSISRIVTVVTNGVLLAKMPEEFWTLIDRMWLSVYPGIKYPNGLEPFEELARKHDVQLWIKRSNEFMVSVLNDRNEDPELVKQIYQKCRYAHLMSCHTVLDGYYYKCSTVPFIEPRLRLKGVQFDSRQRDGVKIHGNPNLRQDIERYLRDPEPLKGCQYCLGTVGKLVPNVQLNKIRRAAELAEDHKDVRAQIDWEAWEQPWEPKQVDPPPWMAEIDERKKKLAKGEHALIK